MSKWERFSLGDLLLDIADGGTPSRLDPQNFDGGIPWAVIDDIKHEIRETKETLSKKGLTSSSAKLWPVDTVILSTGATIGEVGIAKVPLATKQGISGLVCNRRINHRFLYYKLQSLKYYLNSIAQGSTIREVRPPLIKSIEIYLPTIQEQIGIAKVLEVVDDAIEQIETLIHKYQRIKQGLMQDLLTRGVDEKGEVRNENGFIQSLIGRFPQHWTITTLGDIISKYGGMIQTGPFGSQLHSYEYVQEGVPVIMPQDITDSGMITELNIARIPVKKAHELGRHIVQENDVVFARRGNLLRCSAIQEREYGWLCGTGSMLARFPQKIIDGRWLAAIYRHDIGQRQIQARAVGSTMVNLNSQLLKELVVPMPDLIEQKAIMQIIDAQENLITLETANLRKMQSIKNGLMQDLLTGKVRVTGMLDN